MKSSILRFQIVTCWLVAGFAAACSDSIEGGRPGVGVGGNQSSGGVGSGGGAGTKQDTTPRTFGPEDPNLVYSGRILFAEGEPPRFSAPAVTISARFKGVSVAAMLHDASMGNYFDAVIDDDYANAVKIKANPQSGTTEIAKDLPYGEHEITLVKRTEANVGQVEFRGFIFGGDILPPAKAPTRRLEIIGDSISCGSGNEALDGSSQCESARAYSNANKAYGPMLARALGAEYHVTAVSGIGAMRNYDCGDPNTMPEIYDRVFLEAANSPIWDPDHSKYVPDAILVALGTNDFSPGSASCMSLPLNETSDPTHYSAFITELGDLLKTLRGYYPAAEIFLLSSPMLHDGWPDSSYTSDTDQRAALATVAGVVNEDGAEKVHLLLSDFGTTRIAGRGCGSHPNAFEHGIMAGLDSARPSDAAPAELLLNPIKQVMGW